MFLKICLTTSIYRGILHLLINVAEYCVRQHRILGQLSWKTDRTGKLPATLHGSDFYGTPRVG